MTGQVHDVANVEKRRLLFFGAILLLLGLLTGLVSSHLVNPRMGLSAHLEGILNGMLLLVFGAIWSELRGSHSARRIAHGLLLFGTFANWAVTSLAAIWGTKSMTPIAGNVHGALHWQERMIAWGFASVAISMVTAVLLIVVALRTRSRD